MIIIHHQSSLSIIKYHWLISINDASPRWTACLLEMALGSSGLLPLMVAAMRDHLPEGGTSAHRWWFSCIFHTMLVVCDATATGTTGQRISCHRLLVSNSSAGARDHNHTLPRGEQVGEAPLTMIRSDQGLAKHAYAVDWWCVERWIVLNILHSC